MEIGNPQHKDRGNIKDIPDLTFSRKLERMTGIQTGRSQPDAYTDRHNVKASVIDNESNIHFS